ncbi:hypothetical protein [Streptomyces scopuliridis]|uniref:Uncharacterized protein n=1 Tax=Streptomyces scopuliridis RB72 TaxID=1440053 RepID=A0A2T7T9P9_9ACTN|nr:hypothetical protein [Streptomyces scopuliridis]PVE11894.1 hypothetical protein Y717_07585 [Streptomyces scopuliridis RB72]
MTPSGRPLTQALAAPLADRTGRPRAVADLLARYLTALRPGGRLTYFGYRGTTRLRAVFGSSRSLARHSGVVHVLDSFQRAHAVDCRTVRSNVPPARVWQLSAPATTADR